MNQLIEQLSERATAMVELRPNTGVCNMADYNVVFAKLIIERIVARVESWADEQPELYALALEILDDFDIELDGRCDGQA